MGVKESSRGGVTHKEKLIIRFLKNTTAYVAQTSARLSRYGRLDGAAG